GRARARAGPGGPAVGPVPDRRGPAVDLGGGLRPARLLPRRSGGPAAADGQRWGTPDPRARRVPGRAGRSVRDRRAGVRRPALAPALSRTGGPADARGRGVRPDATHPVRPGQPGRLMGTALPRPDPRLAAAGRGTDPDPAPDHRQNLV